MSQNILRRIFIVSACFYLIISVLGIYNENLNSTLFVISFIVFAILITRKLFTLGSLHLFRYVFARTSFYLKKRNKPKQFDSPYEHYQKTSKAVTTSSVFWIFASLIVFVETLLIAVFNAK